MEVGPKRSVALPLRAMRLSFRSPRNVRAAGPPTGAEDAMKDHQRLQRLHATLATLVLCVVLVVLNGSTALAQTPQAAAPTLSDIASYEGPDREKRLIEGAKKEGELMFYSSIPVEDIAALT